MSSGGGWGCASTAGTAWSSRRGGWTTRTAAGRCLRWVCGLAGGAAQRAGRLGATAWPAGCCWCCGSCCWCCGCWTGGGRCQSRHGRRHGRPTRQSSACPRAPARLAPSAHSFNSLCHSPSLRALPCSRLQGGIDPLENPMAAALRELHEETGMRSARIVASVRAALCPLRSARWPLCNMPVALLRAPPAPAWLAEGVQGCAPFRPSPGYSRSTKGALVQTHVRSARPD